MAETSCDCHGIVTLSPGFVSWCWDRSRCGLQKQWPSRPRPRTPRHYFLGFVFSFYKRPNSLLFLVPLKLIHFFFFLTSQVTDEWYRITWLINMLKHVSLFRAPRRPEYLLIFCSWDFLVGSSFGKHGIKGQSPLGIHLMTLYCHQSVLTRCLFFQCCWRIPVGD